MDTLQTLRGIPILMLTGAASYHSTSDPCTSKYLTEAGVNHIFIRLSDMDINGNGHFPVLEKNNLRVAQVIIDFLVAEGL